MIRALVVYGTRYGGTELTAKEIGDEFRKEGLDVKVSNLKENEVEDINEYNLVVVGSGIRIGKWTKEPEKFLKKFQKELANKKVAVFVCCGGAHPLNQGEEKDKEIEDCRTKYLVEKTAKYNLEPVALGLFGGVYNFNRMSWFFKKTMSAIKPQLEAAGFKQVEPGLYDTRDLNAIRSWAREVSQKVNS